MSAKSRFGRAAGKLPRAAAAIAGALLLAAGSGIPSQAQDSTSSPRFEVHGFGGWAYAETDGNRFHTIANDDGNYRNPAATLNFTGKPTRNLTLVVQVAWDTSLDEEDEEVDLEFAFGEWAFSDALRFRIGRGRHPFGIYGDVFEVGTLRPFYLLPLSVYGPQGFTANSYDGAGILGSHYWSNGWGLQYDLYTGELVGDLDVPNIFFADPTLDELPRGYLQQETRTRDLVGTRLVVSTPIDGLSWGASGYQGKREILNEFSLGEQTYTVYAGHLEYARDPWLLRAEYAHNEDDTSEAEGAYFEAAYRFTPRWQIAARWEEWDLSLAGLEPGTIFYDFFEPFLGHEDVAVGINYWFSTNLVLKVNYHMAEGSRFAFPDSEADIERARSTFPFDLETETDVLIVGAHFSF